MVVESSKMDKEIYIFRFFPSIRRVSFNQFLLLLCFWLAFLIFDKIIQGSSISFSGNMSWRNHIWRYVILQVCCSII